MLLILALVAWGGFIRFSRAEKLRDPATTAPATTSAVGRTFYLSTKGDDANDGLSPSTSFASLAKLNAVLSAGDTAKLKRGETFFGTFRPKASGTAAAPILVEAYGKGDKPIITGFKALTQWSAVGGGLYQAVLDPAPAGLLEMVCFDGRLQPKGALAKGRPRVAIRRQGR